MSRILSFGIVLFCAAVLTAMATIAHSQTPKWGAKAGASVTEKLVSMHGEGQSERAERGVDQVLGYWRDEDGVHHVPKRSLADIIIG